MLKIDGSRHEGGGAILRVAAGLSAVTGKDIKIYNIRKGRSRPGLRPQHLQGLRAVAELCTGDLKGDKLNSTEIEFRPGNLKPTEIDVSIDTAGSIGLLFQSLKLPASQTGGEVKVRVKGGATFGKYAPPLLYTKNILLPTLEKMGYRAEININKHGFYPVGGADVDITIHPCKTLRTLELTEPGKIREVKGISVATSHLKKPGVADRQAESCSKILEEKTGLKPKIQTRYVPADCPGSGVVIQAETSTGCILGADGLGEKGKPSEKVGREAAEGLLETIDSGAAVDKYLSDQLLIFMASAQGESRITAPKFTDHARTNMWLIQKFLDVSFQVEKKKNNVIISCSGT